jgi:monoamine oxidase
MILIIGAGLSGLLTAYRLKKENIPFKILEARKRIGGRIYTHYGTDHTPIEMGATWFGNQHSQLIDLLDELNIGYFEQFMEGKVFFQPFSTSPAESIQIPSQPPSYRISGGTSHLIEEIYQKLAKNDILLNQSVREIKFNKNSVQVFTKEMFEGSTVVLAIPPKLWSKNILFTPQLPNNVMTIAKETHTWMEDSVKVALIYKQPFWQHEKYSGTLFSNSGPITELYDHCNHERSKYALCGFLNSSFKSLNYSERQSIVINQLKNVFGTNAEMFSDYKECIWSNEEYTFEKSETPLYPHQNNGNPVFSNTFFDHRLFISSSESAPEFPGYMDGAVRAANTTVNKIIATR